MSMEIVAVLERAAKDLRVIYDRDKSIDDIIHEYGETIIRVHWSFVENARKNPHLEQVCTWSNGDEGFILREDEK